jgi:hypothetical protein
LRREVKRHAATIGLGQRHVLGRVDIET